MKNESYLDVIKELKRRGAIRGEVEHGSAALPDEVVSALTIAGNHAAKMRELGNRTHSIVPPVEAGGKFYIAWLTDEGDAIVISNKKMSKCKEDFRLIMYALKEAAGQLAGNGSQVAMAKVSAKSGEIEAFIDLGIKIPDIPGG